MEGDATVSASSSGTGNAPVKLGHGSYIWQALWNQARALLLTCYGKAVPSLSCCNKRSWWLNHLAPVLQARLMQVVPLTAYIVEAQFGIDSGSGLAGATFFSGSAQKLSAQGIRLSSSGGGVQRGTLVAPPGSYFAALWVGSWAGSFLQVCLSAPATFWVLRM